MYGLLKGCGSQLTPLQRREWRGFLCGVCESLSCRSVIRCGPSDLAQPEPRR